MVETRLPGAGERMIPPEILQFLRVPGRSLLVRGRAGTGKTMFALGLSRVYQAERGDVVWAESRDPDPVAAEALERVVPAGQRLRVGDAAPAVEDALTAAEEVADPAAAFGVLDDLATAARESRFPLLVLDSLDGLTEGLSRQQRTRFVVAAVRLARRLRASLLLVVESAEPDRVDYLVDGIVHARERVDAGVRLREIHLEKLRGIPLPRTAYAFTLTEGRFAAFAPGRPEPPEPPVRPPPLPAPVGRVSTGVADWDALQGGGFHRGSVHLLELGPGAGRVQEDLVLPLAVNTLNEGAGLVFVPPPNHAARDLEAVLAPHAATDRLFALDGDALTRPLSFGDDPADHDERLAPLVAARRRHRAEGPVVSVLGLDALSFAFGADAAARWLARWTAQTRAHGDVDVLLARAGGALSAEGVADVRWRVDAVRDVSALRRLTPATEYHFLDPATHRGFPETRLVPIH